MYGRPSHRTVEKQEAFMSKTTVARKTPSITPAPTKGTADSAAFERLFYTHISADDLAQLDKATRHSIADSLWGFAATRVPGTANVRIFRPRRSTHGWDVRHTVLEIVNDDLPFVADSVAAELARRGLMVHLVMHAKISVRRDAKGTLQGLTGVKDAGSGTAQESILHIQIDETTDEQSLQDILRGVERVLTEVRQAVTDWAAMLSAVKDSVQQIESVGKTPDAKEAAAFLTWARSNHFTFLGCRDYQISTSKDKTGLFAVTENALGILQSETIAPFDGLKDGEHQPPEIRAFLASNTPILVTKTNRPSRVHRSVPMDAIFVKRFDKNGKTTGLRLFLGLFTSATYSSQPQDIPYLRHKVELVMKKSGFDANGHAGKALLHILSNYPRDELFQIGDADLLRISMGILQLQERNRIGLFLRKDPFERFVTALIFVPRDRYDTDTRIKFQQVLERALDGRTRSFSVRLDDNPLGQAFLVVTTQPGQIPAYDETAIAAELGEITRPWADRLRDAMVDTMGEERGVATLRRFADAFPWDYCALVPPQDSLKDIVLIDETAQNGRLSADLFRARGDRGREMHLKLFHYGTPLTLSHVMPVMENMGLDVIAEWGPFPVQPAGSDAPVFLHDFRILAGNHGQMLDLPLLKPLVEDALAATFEGRIEDDGFNRLIIAAALNWREVSLIRAFGKYLRQARLPYTTELMADTLVKYPDAARLLVDQFIALHDPKKKPADRAKAEKAKADFTALLAAVDNLDEDRILRRFANLVDVVLRTNFFQTEADGQPKSYISFKMDSSRIEDLPLPRPMVEIFVCSPRVEAVHLRGGKVARGGIRWSDRREDFRTEILGLMKAQMVKNTVIIPVGSKGGFVVKKPPKDRAAFQAEGIACYQTMMRGMLDITDNLVGGKVVPPQNVVRLDGDDPYLVVAADKGTAKFSDIANAISQDYGFWLDDAFASGGSAGYDHKGMGITARGAWEAVKRHFREIGKDIQEEPFTCIGVGDMAGDVFGNGMLLSRQTKLIGAFNHVHIFCDPTPDPETSWKERERLFTTPGTSWLDYDAKRISKGGGVFLRSAKSIAISPQMKAAYGIDKDQMSPDDLIRAMLRVDVDLLWFGGIGTFIKAPHETHADAGDKANDALRVNADEVQAKIIGEGANLGMTQAARIAYAQKGGRLNTDAIDNSAGVDTSDHEVNIKILLGDPKISGQQTVKQRNALLARMTDEVGDLVLEDNYLQTQILTMMEASAAALLPQHARLMRILEKTVGLNRAVEFLPDKDAVSDRAKIGLGLTRPELAVILAYSKIALYNDVLASDLPDDRGMGQELMQYFPKALRDKYAPEIARHRLRREIITTRITGTLINRLGCHVPAILAEKTQRSSADVVRAFLIVRDVFGLSALWKAIESLDNKVPAAVQTTMLQAVATLAEQGMGWFLTRGAGALDLEKMVAQFKPALQELASWLATAPSCIDQAQITERQKALQSAGVGAALASQIAVLPVLAAALDIASLAAREKQKVSAIADIYFAIEQRFGMGWLRAHADAIKPENQWQREAVAALFEDLASLHGNLARSVLELAKGSGKAAAAKSKGKDAKDPVAAWGIQHAPAVARVDQMLMELRAAPSIDLAMLALAARQVSILTRR
jgi:glutamate dehydrogenase